MTTPQENITLAPFTTFKIGGPAKFFIEAKSAQEISAALDWAEEKGVPSFLLAGGSNILFSDAGFDGLVIHIVEGGCHISNASVVAPAGSNLKELIDNVNEHGLAGMAEMSGIPGSLGGAVRGNAGAFGREIGDFVSCVKALDIKTGFVREFTQEECQFQYRCSYFKTHKEWVILEVKLAFTQEEDPDELKKLAKEIRARREAKHPQDAMCAGSFFMNPKVTNPHLLQEFEEETGTPSRNGVLPAGWLVAHVGLRGKKIGGAQMSPKHPNYLINTGTAKAEDVVMLSSFVKTRVRNQLGIQLKEEIQLVGF